MIAGSADGAGLTVREKRGQVRGPLLELGVHERMVGGARGVHGIAGGLERLALGGDARACDLHGCDRSITLTDEHLECPEALDLRLQGSGTVGEKSGLAECGLGLREAVGEECRISTCLRDAQGQVVGECVAPGALCSARLRGGLPLGEGLQARPLRDDVMGERLEGGVIESGDLGSGGRMRAVEGGTRFVRGMGRGGLGAGVVLTRACAVEGRGGEGSGRGRRGGTLADVGDDGFRIELLGHLDDLRRALAHDPEDAVYLGDRIAAHAQGVIRSVLEVLLDALEESVVDEPRHGVVALAWLGAQERVELALGKHDESAELIDRQADALDEVGTDLARLAHVGGAVVLDHQGLRGALRGRALAAGLATFVRRTAGDRVADATDAELEGDLGGLVGVAELAAHARAIRLRTREGAVESEDDAVDDRRLARTGGTLDEEEP